MYGAGIFKGLVVTMTNFVLPSRQFNVVQYPDKKASPLDLAKEQDKQYSKDKESTHAYHMDEYNK